MADLSDVLSWRFDVCAEVEQDFVFSVLSIDQFWEIAQR